MPWGFLILMLAALGSVMSTDSNDDPMLKVISRMRVFNIGERKAIFCRGKPELTEEINWYSPSGELILNHTVDPRRFIERRTDNGYFLVPLLFRELKMSDSGQWLCKAGEYKVPIELKVGRKVNMSKLTDEKVGDEGKSVKLNCEANGDPLPVVQWYKDTRALNSDGKKYEILKKGYMHTLEIKNLTHTDVGAYVCKVTQKALTHFLDKTITLSVKHAPVVHPYLSTSKAVETFGILNETKNLTCGAQANPLPTYQWYRVNKGHFDTEIVDGDNIYTAPDASESIMSLRLRTKADLGQYKCKISNTKGTKTVIFDVLSGYKPNPPDEVILLGSNVTSLSFNVSCSNCDGMPQSEDDTTEHANLTILGYQFQLTPFVKDYLPDWDVAYERMVYLSQDGTYVVSGLPNTTQFHVRVRSMNDAGYSDWFDLTDHPSTTAHAVRLAVSILALLAVILALMY